MNVLFVIRATGSFTTQQAQLGLFTGLLQKGIKMILVGELSQEVIEFLDKKKINYIDTYPKTKIDKNYIKKFKSIIEEYQVNIVHFVDGKASRSGLIALKKYPKIKALTYFGSISLHWYDPSAYLTYLHPRLNAIICNSNYVYNHVKKQLFGKNKQKAVRIFKGYNPSWFTNITPFDYTSIGIPKEAIIVCSIGNHRKVKGTNFFLESSNFLESKKDIHYVLIGHNTDTPHLTKIAKNSKISDKIHFLGGKTNVVSLIKGVDIYAQTSISEGLGRALTEAMSVGKPAVSTNSGGGAELVGENGGIITPIKDAKAIGKAISTLANNDKIRIEMGENAKKRIQTVFHIDRTIEETLALYKKLLNE